MKRVEKLFYKILIFVAHDGVKYDFFVIDSNKDLQVRTHELFDKLGDVVCSDNQPFGELAIEIADTPVIVPISGEGGAPDGVEDALREDDDDDDDDDDVDPATIANDRNDDIAGSFSVGDGGASSSKT
ncbi:hypothetical protein Ahy_B05g079426 [Arachis hypogaea]|uniref:Uncharacterized protein n=1 Tax=Arachis hypogaea TaxID=3818 RepID=A0A444Z9T4_ARAHY|nr:hypothetical protein Ahy_B05g079426 [Arachis hypogaea]